MKPSTAFCEEKAYHGICFRQDREDGTLDLVYKGDWEGDITLA